MDECEEHFGGTKNWCGGKIFILWQARYNSREYTGITDNQENLVEPPEE